MCGGPGGEGGGERVVPGPQGNTRLQAPLPPTQRLCSG